MAITANEIVDEKSLKQWLADQPKEVAQAIAARAALRVLPIVLAEHGREGSRLSVTQKLDLTSTCFRATFTSWVARKYPTHDVRLFAARAARAARAAGAAARAAGAAGAADAARAAAFAADAAAGAAVRVVAGAAARAAAGAADAARAAAFAAVRADAKWLEARSGDGPQMGKALIEQPLWLSPSNEPIHYRDLQSQMRKHLYEFRDLCQTDPDLEHFGVIADWYSALLPESGQPRSLFGETLYLELATQNKAFWEGDASEVMKRVADLVGWPERYERLRETPVSYFISYSTKDESAAKFIGDVIEETGSKVIAQYKDFVTGSTFVEEMKQGLGGTDRFVPVLSPHYEASDMCQSEWNCAYRVDPLGTKRKMVPFLIAPTKLNALAAGFVYTNLVNQTNERRRELIIEALRIGSGLSRNEQRLRLEKLSSPQVTVTEDGKLDTEPNDLADQPVANPELIDDIDRMKNLLRGLIQQFEGSNQVGAFNNMLKTYLSELDVNGVEPRVGDLVDAAEIIMAEFLEDRDKLFFRGSARKSLEQLGGLHNKILGYFPQDAVRNKLEAKAEVNQECLEKDELNEDLAELEAASAEAERDKKVTREFANTIQQKIEKKRQLSKLQETGLPVIEDDIFVSPEDRIVSFEEKKRKWGANLGAFLDNALGRAEKAVSIVESDTGKALISTAAKIVSKLWD